MKKLYENNSVIIIALLVIQLAVCIPFISGFPIALDEPFSIFWAQQDMIEMSDLFANENNPPLHFVLLHFWIKCFGISALAVRTLSLLFSLFSIVVLFKLSLKLLSRELAVFVVLLFISTQFNHFHSLEARTYSLLLLVFLLIVYDLFLLLFENKNVFWRLAIWNGLLLYTHYIGPLIIGVELLVILIFINNISKKRILYFGLSFGSSLVLFLPGLKLFLLRLNKFSDSGTWLPEAHYSELYGNIVRFFNGKLVVLTIILLLILFAFIYRKLIIAQAKVVFSLKGYYYILWLFVFSYFGMFAFSKLIQPVFLDRYLLFTTIPLFLLLGILCQIILNRAQHYLAFIILIPIILTTDWLPNNDREPNAEINYVQQIQMENTAIVICPPYYDLTFLYHYDRNAFSNYRELEAFKEKSEIFAVYSIDGIGILEGKEQIIFIDNNSKQLFPKNGVLDGLTMCFTLLDSAIFKGGSTIYNFRKL